MHHHVRLKARPTLAACLLAASAIGGAASRAHADTITVCPGGTCDFTDPAAAVAAAVAGDTIEIAAGTYVLTSPLSLNGKNLTIRGAVDAIGGPATVLDGLNAPQYQIYAAHLTDTTIENLVLTNGQVGQWPLYITACTGMTITNCSIVGNRAGGMYLNGTTGSPGIASVTMRGCAIVNNGAAHPPPFGGGIICYGVLTLDSCVVSGNTSVEPGSAIFLSGDPTHLVVKDSRICGNLPSYELQIFQDPTTTWENYDGSSCIEERCDDCLPTTGCPADLDGNGYVNGIDLGNLLNAWGTCSMCAADLSDDGSVNGDDLGILLNAWGACR